MTMFEEACSVYGAIRAGAQGYVLKDADEEEMLRAIRAVGHGEAIFSSAAAAAARGNTVPLVANGGDFSDALTLSVN